MDILFFLWMIIFMEVGKTGSRKQMGIPYFPIQKFLKIFPSVSSVVISPVI
jgi:hypothetical protein